MFQMKQRYMLIMTLWVLSANLTGLGYGQEIVLADFNAAQQAVPAGWELIVNKGDADLRLMSETSGQALQLRSKSASFAIQKEAHIDLQETPYLEWTWKVTQLPSGGDFRQRQTDDQAAQLIVSFSATRFISYIWDSSAPKGLFGKAPSPPFRKIMAWVLQSGSQDLGEWKTERRNLVDDYIRLFGKAPKALRGLRIQINSQHTQTQAEASWKSIVLTNSQRTATRHLDQRIPPTRPILLTFKTR